MQKLIMQILEGIDGTELEGGWWETSTGAEFGARKLKAINGIFSQQGTMTAPKGMPRKLTAENGAKALLIGEFKETVNIACQACHGLGEDDWNLECETCGGSGEMTLNVPVEWSTIKQIYAMVVEHYGK